jgi:dihydrofolate reductase
MMRKLIVQSFASLDGVIQSISAPDEDPEGGFEHGGWLTPRVDDAFMQIVTESIQRAGALLLGRKTYEIFAAAWPLIGDDDPIAAVFNRVPKHVASRTLSSAEWDHSTIISGDIPEAVNALKQQDGNEIQVHGSGALVQTLMLHDLIDEYRLYMVPVLIGSGKRLFDDGTVPRSLRLVETRTTPSGVIYGTYEPTGDLTVGSYEPEHESTV